MMMIFSLRVSGSCLLLLTHRYLQLGPGAPSKKREFTEIVFEFEIFDVKAVVADGKKCLREH